MNDNFYAILDQARTIIRSVKMPDYDEGTARILQRLEVLYSWGITLDVEYLIKIVTAYQNSVAHPTQVISLKGQEVIVDQRLVKTIEELWRQNITTNFSCQGDDEVVKISHNDANYESCKWGYISGVFPDWLLQKVQNSGLFVEKIGDRDCIRNLCHNNLRDFATTMEQILEIDENTNGISIDH